MNYKYQIVCGWSGYDVFATDENGYRNQIAYGVPHFDAAIRMAVSHAGRPVVLHADAIV